MTRKPVAFGYTPQDRPAVYLLQVTTYRSDAADDYSQHTLTFQSKAEAMAYAKRSGMTFTS